MSTQNKHLLDACQWSLSVAHLILLVWISSTPEVQMCFKHICDSDYSEPEPGKNKNKKRNTSQTWLEGTLFLKPHVIKCKQVWNVLQLNWSVSISRVARGNGDFFDRMNKILQKQDSLLSAGQTEVYNHILQKIASLLLPRCIPVTTFPGVLKNQVILKQFFLLSIAAGFSDQQTSLFPSYTDLPLPLI